MEAVLGEASPASYDGGPPCLPVCSQLPFDLFEAPQSLTLYCMLSSRPVTGFQTPDPTGFR
jgi:hypothetical protein